VCWPLGCGSYFTSFISQLAGISPHYFCDLFKKSTGLTPHQYLVRCRIDQAKIFLRSCEFGINQVAKATGFADRVSAVEGWLTTPGTERSAIARHAESAELDLAHERSCSQSHSRAHIRAGRLRRHEGHAPARQSRKEEFTESLLEFIQTSGFAACVFLSGVDMSNRTDAQMLSV